MDLPLIFYIANTVFIAILLGLAVNLARDTSKFNYHIGRDDIQGPLVSKILKEILAVIAVGTLAAVFNMLLV